MQKIRKVFVYLCIIFFFTSILNYLFRSTNNHINVDVTMKQSQKAKVCVEYKEHEYDAPNRNNIKKTLKSSEVFSTLRFEIPKNYIYSVDLKLYGEKNSINNVQVEKVEISTLFSKKTISKFNHAKLEVDEYYKVNLDDGYIFNDFQINKKIKIISLLFSLILLLILRKRIDSFLIVKDNLIDYDRFKVAAFIISLSGIFIINAIVIDSKSSYISGGLTQKPEISANYKNIKDGSFMTDTEKYFKEQFFYRDTFLEDYYAFNTTLQKKTFAPNYITKNEKNETDLLRYLEFDKKSIDKNINTLENLNEKLEEKDIPYYYFLAPDKVAFYDDLNKTIENNYEESVSYYGKKLTESGINYIYLFDEIEENVYNKSHNTHFLTDHHWTFESAFIAYQEILNNLQQEGILAEEDMRTMDDFEVKSFENIFSGSIARNLAYGYRYNQELEDINLYLPKEDGSYVKTYISGKTERKGTFKEILNTPALNPTVKYLNTYAVYDSDYSMIIENENQNNGKEILVLKDSYGIPVTHFLTQNFEKVTVLDQRNLDKGYVVDYIERENPDVVINVSNPSTIADIEAFKYFK